MHVHAHAFEDAVIVFAVQSLEHRGEHGFAVDCQLFEGGFDGFQLFGLKSRDLLDADCSQLNGPGQVIGNGGCLEVALLGNLLDGAKFLEKV